VQTRIPGQGGTHSPPVSEQIVPKPPTTEQCAQLEQAGQLQEASLATPVQADHGKATLRFALPQQAVSE